MDPLPFTLRELMIMSTAKQDGDDMRNAALMALIANCKRDAKKTPRAYSPKDFMPQRTTVKSEKPQGTMDDLKRAFIRN